MEGIGSAENKHVKWCSKGGHGQKIQAFGKVAISPGRRESSTAMSAGRKKMSQWFVFRCLCTHLVIR
eukprot:1390948-Amorphochlora_amoeboformis.AAC.1